MGLFRSGICILRDVWTLDYLPSIAVELLYWSEKSCTRVMSFYLSLASNDDYVDSKFVILPYCLEVASMEDTHAGQMDWLVNVSNDSVLFYPYPQTCPTQVGSHPHCNDICAIRFPAIHNQRSWFMLPCCARIKGKK